VSGFQTALRVLSKLTFVCFRRNRENGENLSSWVCQSTRDFSGIIALLGEMNATYSFAAATGQAFGNLSRNSRDLLMMTTSSKSLKNSLRSWTTVMSVKRNSTSTSISGMKTKTALSPLHPQEIILLKLPLMR